MERFNHLRVRKIQKQALIAIGHSLLVAVHYVLSTGGRYKELGDRYVPDRIEKKRKEYLKSELKKTRIRSCLDEEERLAYTILSWGLS